MKRPQSIQELLELPIGSAVFDAHDYFPKWIDEPGCETKSIWVPQSMAQWIILQILPAGKFMMNKLVYLAGRDEERLTLVCSYDNRGILYSIEL